MVHRHVTRTRCPSDPPHIQPNLWEPRYQRVHRHISSPDLTRKYVKIQQPNNQLEVATVSSYDSCANLFPIWLQDCLEEYHQGDWLWGDQSWLSWIWQLRKRTLNFWPVSREPRWSKCTMESCHWRKQINTTLRLRPARRKRQSKTMIRWTLLRIAELSVVLSLLILRHLCFTCFFKDMFCLFGESELKNQNDHAWGWRYWLDATAHIIIFVLGTVNVAAWMTSDAQPNTHDVYRTHLYSCMKYVYRGIL